MDNPKAAVLPHQKFGSGVFAKENISKNEVIATFDGTIYTAEKCSDLPNDPPLKIRDHAIQTGMHTWQDSNGIGRFFNHSCEPNCGIKGKTNLVALKDIKNGEELTFDYDMTENSDWAMECKCRRANCRKIIRGYRFLPGAVKKKYRGMISEWLGE